MAYSKLTSKNQATIPIQIRKQLSIKAGDRIIFEIRADGSVVVNKAQPIDIEYSKALKDTLSEWESQEDEDDYGNL